MLLTDDFLKRWEEIVDQVDKEQIPIHCVKKVIFKTKNKTRKTINLKRLRDKGHGEPAIEILVEEFITEHEQDIISMEFVLDVDAVALAVQPETDRLLRDIP